MRAILVVIALAVSALLSGAPVALATAQTPAAAPRQQPPPPAPERPFQFPSHTTSTLDNGMTVFVIRDDRQPVVAATLMLPGAAASGHSGTQAGLAAMTAALLRQGTSTRSAHQIAEAIDRVGGTLSASAGPDYTQVSVTALTSALDTGFELLADVAQRPAFAAEEIERWRRQSLSGLQVAYSDPEYLLGVVGQRVAFGDHPYAFPTDGLPETVRALTREDVAGFYKERYTPAGAYLAIAGDITPDAATAMARKYFGGWKGSAVAPASMAPGRQDRRVVVIDMPDAVQTQFGMFGPGIPRNHPDWLALSVANQVLGAGFNSRLNLRLRAQEGLTYGAGSSVESLRFGGRISATSFTRTEETAKAMDLMLDVIRDFRTNPVTPAELAEATAYLSGVFAIQTETAGAVANRVLLAALHDLPAGYWQTYRERVRKVDAAEVTGAVERHVIPEQLSVVAVGNASGFAASVEQLGAVTIIPIAQLDLTQPSLTARRETATGPDAAARGMALIKAAAEAAGGAARLAAVKDISTVGELTLSTPGGEMQGKTTAAVVPPDRLRLSITLPIGELVQVYDGTNAWLQMGPQPATDLPADMHREMQRSILMSGGIGVLREALEGRADVAALESKTVDGQVLERVSWTRGDIEMVLGFDPATHHIVNVAYRGLTPQGPADSELRLADYKAAENGIVVPMRSATYQNGQKVAEMIVSEWRFNTGIPAETFAK